MAVLEMFRRFLFLRWCCPSMFFFLQSCDWLFIQLLHVWSHPKTFSSCNHCSSYCTVLHPLHYLSLLLQMPNNVRRPSSALKLVLGATPCPRALAPRWITVLTTQQRRLRVRVPPRRKHWSWSSAGSKGRGRRTAGLKTSRWLVLAGFH